MSEVEFLEDRNTLRLEVRKILEDLLNQEEKIDQAARDAGVELAGIAPVRDFPELQRFEDWIGAGHAGEMNYMETRDEAGQLKRASLRSTIPWARSVIVCAINYNTAQPLSTQVS